MRVIKIFLILVFIISGKVFSEQNNNYKLTVPIESNKEINLYEAPKTLEISDPTIISVQRIGFTNKVRIEALQPGEATLTVHYLGGKYSHYNIKVPNNSLYSNNFTNKSPLSVRVFSQKIDRLKGIRTKIEDNTIVVTGEIYDLQTFRQYIVYSQNQAIDIIPAFSFDSKILPFCLASLSEDLAAMGERELVLFQKSGVTMLGGAPSGIKGKQRALNFLQKILPGLIDATSSISDGQESVTIQIKFLEIGKNGMAEFGTQLLGTNKNTLSATTSFPLNSIKPNLQVAPLTGLFKAIQGSGTAREIASPILIAKNREKATFIAGGEVPYLIKTEEEEKVHFKPFGIVLTVVPTSLGGNKVNLKLEAEFSSINENLGSKEVPGFLTRRISTSLVLKEGNVGVLSGLIRSKDVKKVSKIPIIGHLPIIGELFKSREFIEEKSELWIVVSIATDNKISKRGIDIDKVYEEYEDKVNFSIFD